MLPRSVDRALALFARLPGVGEKTAHRFVLHLIGEGGELAQKLGEELAELARRVRPCERCGHLAERDDEGHAVCGICADSKRDASLLCVVGRMQDVLAIERSGAFRGRYHVLGRLLSPLDGVGPAELRVDQIRARVTADGVREVVVATPPSVDGEATALFLARELRGAEVRVTRIASGIPHGGELEYADQITLGRAFHHRHRLDE